MPVMGAALLFDTPYDHRNFTISYDIFVTEKLKSDFEFTVFSINEYDEYLPVAGIGVENRGNFYLIKDDMYSSEPVDAEWSPNTWMNIKLKVDEDSIYLLINNVQEASVPVITRLDIMGMNMLHNNYGGTAYYDNIRINEVESGLAVKSITQNGVNVYPNPAIENVTISTPEGVQISNISIFNINGQKVAEGTTKEMNVESLATGTYTIKATTTEGKVFTRKIVKQ